MLKSKRIRFDNAGYFFIGILLVTIVGFTPSYFSKLPSQETTFNFYIHFHAFNMLLWLAILISQPFLIRNNHIKWHKGIGKFTYVFFPVLVLSVFLLIHDRLQITSDIPEHLRFYFPIKDLFVIIPCYILAMYFRKNPMYHARFMIGTSFQLIEPGLARAVNYHIPFSNPIFGALTTFLIIDIIVVSFIIMDRKQQKGRWIFPLILGMILFIQLFLISGGPDTDAFKGLVTAFKGLPLT